MHKKLQVWKLISQSLQDNLPVMLLHVLESFGSSPGREGFCMAVNVTGEMAGSIGGGIMEHKFVELAKEKLKNNEEINAVYKQVHDKEALKFQSGMICSGEQSNFIYTVKSRDYLTVIQILESLQKDIPGTLRLSENGIQFLNELTDEEFKYARESETNWVYEEHLGYKNYLHIIGAGHCALELSKVMQALDFHISLYDDRDSLPTYLHNEFAHKKYMVDNYKILDELIPSGDNYVVVMTVGYRTDDIVVRALLDKEFRYFGVLGSEKKIEKLFVTYRSEGIDEEKLNKIYAPIGVNINSQTPEEIVISIAAQIIKVKNAGKQ